MKIRRFPSRFPRLAAVLLVSAALAGFAEAGDLLVGASAVNVKVDDAMVIGGSILPKYAEGQEGELRVVAVVGIPAEYFTGLGIDIKERSPFPHTVIAALANDWVGYLSDCEAHELGGYQTWMELHSYAEVGTGERVADEIVEMLHELKEP